MISHLSEAEMASIISYRTSEKLDSFCRAMTKAFYRRYGTYAIEDIALAAMESLVFSVDASLSTNVESGLTLEDSSLERAGETALITLGAALDSVVFGYDDLLVYARCCIWPKLTDAFAMEDACDWAMEPLDFKRGNLWLSVLRPNDVLPSTEATMVSLRTLLEMRLLIETSEGIMLPQNAD